MKKIFLAAAYLLISTQASAINLDFKCNGLVDTLVLAHGTIISLESGEEKNSLNVLMGYEGTSGEATERSIPFEAYSMSASPRDGLKIFAHIFYYMSSVEPRKVRNLVISIPEFYAFGFSRPDSMWYDAKAELSAWRDHGEPVSPVWTTGLKCQFGLNK